MQSLLLRYATPFITGLFLVSLISGLALFFHIGPSGFHGMHEILSLALILPFALHLWKNWRPMTVYFTRAPMAVALGVSTLAGAAFLLPAAGEDRAGGPPQFAVAQMLLQASPSVAAPALGLTGAELEARLTAAGFVATGAPSLHDIATAAGRSDAALLAALAQTP